MAYEWALDFDGTSMVLDCQIYNGTSLWTMMSFHTSPDSMRVARLVARQSGRNGITRGYTSALRWLASWLSQTLEIPPYLYSLIYATTAEAPRVEPRLLAIHKRKLSRRYSVATYLQVLFRLDIASEGVWESGSQISKDWCFQTSLLGSSMNNSRMQATRIIRSPFDALTDNKSHPVIPCKLCLTDEIPLIDSEIRFWV